MHSFGKFVFRDSRLIPGLQPIVINRLRRAMEKLRNLYTVVYSEPDESIYSQLRIQEFAFFQDNSFFITQKRIEVLHKIRIYMKKNSVEAMVKLFQFPLYNGIARNQ